MNQYTTPPDKDPHLWQIAQRRASFKYHFAVYIVVNLFFWILWFITDSRDAGREDGSWPWPIWPLIGWGIGVIFHYLGAYVLPKENTVEKEYEKLKREQGNKL